MRQTWRGAAVPTAAKSPDAPSPSGAPLSEAGTQAPLPEQRGPCIPLLLPTPSVYTQEQLSHGPCRSNAAPPHTAPPAPDFTPLCNSVPTPSLPKQFKNETRVGRASETVRSAEVVSDWLGQTRSSGAVLRRRCPQSVFFDLKTIGEATPFEKAQCLHPQRCPHAKCL